MAKFVIQAAGISWLSLTLGLFSLYAGFFLYGIGMGGTSILAALIWANYFGRVSLGKIRGMGSLVTHGFSAGGPPFFGFLFDATQSYMLSFSIFVGLADRFSGIEFVSSAADKVGRAQIRNLNLGNHILVQIALL